MAWKVLNRSKLQFIWFGKINKQKIIGSPRRVETIDSRVDV